MKQNVWIINHYAGNVYFDRGGRHYAFAKYLKKQGYNPVVFCANSKHNAEGYWFDEPGLWRMHYAEEIDVPFVYVTARSYVNNGKQRVLNMLDFYRNVKKVAKEYAAENGVPDVIFASSAHPLTLVAGLQLAKHFKVKCICEVRDLWPESIVVYSNRLTRKNPLIWALYQGEKWIYKKADALIFTMEGAYEYIQDRGWEKKIPRSKVYFINNGVDLEQFCYNEKNFRVDDQDLNDPDTFKVGYTGSIRKANNLGLLLDVAKKVQAPNVRFLIWGSGDEVPMLKQRLVDENITNVLFKGRVEKKYVPYITEKMDINYLDPFTDEIARYGISSNKLFDYFAAEKPILMGFSGKYNPAQNYGCSVICQPEKAALLDGLLQIVDLSEQEYRKMCDGAKRATEQYNVQQLTQMLIAVIERV